ncbi:hypothetical protein THAOC_21569 [Thalassiosira oceanica]|uniref:Uncharacterized protein n=1 Tax=Thalassiosira oceanica TaxID=159749 RepID=K0RX29_THAOC|nr:hypothetical protein THAOC_21569 [Thalassiosira oceanica]|eukprot:EJK58323.1 hypothetical protein THAOC_21569 [Thalassiosira oceanica]
MLDVLAGDTKRNKPLASRSHCTRIDSPAPEKIVDVSDLVVNWKNPNLDSVPARWRRGGESKTERERKQWWKSCGRREDRAETKPSLATQEIKRAGFSKRGFLTVQNPSPDTTHMEIRFAAQGKGTERTGRKIENELHQTLLAKKAAKDEKTDKMISCLFPLDQDDGSVRSLCERLRAKRPASDMLVTIVERLHEREVAARGIEHVEPESGHDNAVSFKRVSAPNEQELEKIIGLVDRLIEAAEVLDEEFQGRKAAREEGATHSSDLHFGGGDLAGILKAKRLELGREHDDQFQERLQSFYDAAKRKHSYDEVSREDLMDSDVWKN